MDIEKDDFLNVEERRRTNSIAVVADTQKISVLTQLEDGIPDFSEWKIVEESQGS